MLHEHFSNVTTSQGCVAGILTLDGELVAGRGVCAAGGRTGFRDAIVPGNREFSDRIWAGTDPREGEQPRRDREPTLNFE